MDIVITEWALQAYLDLKAARAFSDNDYKDSIRPSVKLLKDGFPSNYTIFNSDKFWSPAIDKRGRIPSCFKMKWHNLNNGNTPQLRLGVMIWDDTAILCRAYADKTHEHLELARLRFHAARIMEGQFTWRGAL